MDTDTIAARGLAPLRADLALIEGATSQAELTGVLGALQRTGGAGGASSSSSTTTPRSPTRYVVHLVQGGLGLPDEAYYRDEQYAAVLAAYRPHVARDARASAARRRTPRPRTSSRAGSWRWRPSSPPGTGTSSRTATPTSPTTR